MRGVRSGLKGRIADETAKDPRAARGLRTPCGASRRSTISPPARLLCGLVHAGNTVDPVTSQFDGDISERITPRPRCISCSSRFEPQPRRRRGDRARHGDAGARPLPAVDRGPAQGQALSVEDRVEQLFHEKSVTAYGAWNRQFDQTIAALRFKVEGKELAIESTLTRCCRIARRPSAAPRRRRWRKTFKANERTFALITNTLAKDKEISDRWRGFQDIADARHLANRVEREGGGMRLSLPSAPPIRGCRTATTR